MKKIICLLLACVFLLSFGGCADESCSHSYSSVVTQKATCTQNGIKTFTCSLCNDTYTEDIPKLSTSSTHQYIGSTTKRATCSRVGKKKYTCSVCKDYYTEEIPMLEHTYTCQTNKMATCTQKGQKEYTCGVCGYSYNEEYSLQIYSSEDIYDMAKDVAVEIKTYDKSGAGLALGSGFVYSKDGKIITNYHVIEDAYTADVYIGDTKYSVASVLGYDKDIDIAILKINASNLATLTICSAPVKTGSQVYALGSSRGLTSTFSRGVISTANREMDGVKYIQHDAAISNGNSGGPLLNEYCEIIGINTLTIKDSQNLNFAINVSEIDNVDKSKSYTLKEIYDKENPPAPTPSSDVFTTLKNYIISKGKYDSTDKEYDLSFGYVYLDSLAYTTGAIYTPADGTITLTLFMTDNNMASMVFIEIDTIDGVYKWVYVDAYEQYMVGNIYGSTFNSNTILSYTNYSGISTTSLRNTVRELASTMVRLLIINVNIDYASIGVTAKSLGFVNY